MDIFDEALVSNQSDQSTVPSVAHPSQTEPMLSSSNVTTTPDSSEIDEILDLLRKKDWQNLISDDYRKNWVLDLVEGIFQYVISPHKVTDERSKDVIMYAEKIERDIFESADSESEYKHLLKEKYDKIRTKLSERHETLDQHGQSAAPSQSSDMPCPSSSEQIQPNNNVKKEWHKLINMELRRYLVLKIQAVILRTSASSVDMRDDLLKKVELYAEQVERQAFETSNSKSEYYHIIAERNYKIDRALDEIRRKRQNLRQ